MLPHPTPLLTRLRRHRGLWALLLAVVLVKLVTSSICLGDRVAMVAVVAGAATLAASDAATEDACLLGESGDCHCACVHALPLASHGVSLASVSAPKTRPLSFFAPDHLPPARGSLLRPPIA